MPLSSRRTGISPRFMVSANSEEGAMCLLRRERQKRMVPRMRSARKTTPPITPPAMAPTLTVDEPLDTDAATGDDVGDVV
jgi:hypothetical protein